MNENDVLIARFEGWEYIEELYTDNSDIGGVYTKVIFLSKVPIPSYSGYVDERWLRSFKWDERPCKEINEFSYSSSWDSLMPVIAKVIQICQETNDERTYISILSCIPNLELTYEKVLEFIKSYQP